MEDGIEQGRGFPVVFLHGWGGSKDSFAFVAAALKRSYRVVRLDLAGFGDAPEPSDAWGSDDYAVHVAKRLEALGIEECALVCHSFGGRVGIALAAEYPGLIRALVLVDSAGIKPKRSIKKRRREARYRRAKRRGEDLSSYGSPDYREASDGLRKTFVRIVNEDLAPLLPKIGCPTLLVWGRKDRDTPLYMARKLHAGIRDSGLVLLNGGHFSYLDEPYTFVRVLGSFLTEVSR